MVKAGNWRSARSILVACIVVWAPQVRADDLAQRVLIVYNEQNPDSKPLADYYAQKRGVPTNQVCAIHVRYDETITRREFNEEVLDPIERFMLHNRLLVQQPSTIDDPLLGSVPSLQTVDCRISYIVLMYGVPLRIDTDKSIIERAENLSMRKELKRDEASVESELALLPTANHPLLGPLPNPFFGSQASRFEAPMNRQMLLVGRLDGPDPATVRRMIDDALATEYYGLNGRAYFDAQGTTDKGYVMGDDWIKASNRMFREAGFECVLDEQPEVFNQDFPMTDAAIYAGWYEPRVTGPFVRKDFKFRAGAIAYHIHSSSGASIRTSVGHWVGPLLAKGAAASMGNVYEPYLTFTPHIDRFFQRLLKGGIFIEAAYCSEPALSWQTTFVGDPLYAPFKTSVDDQIARLEADKKPDVEWAYLRKVNLLLLAGRRAEAETLCRVKAEVLSSTVLWEKCGDIAHSAVHDDDAIGWYKKALEQTSDLYRKIRIMAKLAVAYENNREPNLALAKYEQLTQLVPDARNAVEYFKKVRDLEFATGQRDKAEALQPRIDELVKQGQKK